MRPPRWDHWHHTPDGHVRRIRTARLSSLGRAALGEDR